MSDKNKEKWTKYAEDYDPIKVGSIDGLCLLFNVDKV